MKRLLLFLLLAASTQATQITGTIKDPGGNGINGRMTIRLSQSGQDSSANQLIAPRLITYPLVNGVPPTFANVVGNDVIRPGGTYYVVKFYDSSSAQVSAANFVITGVTFDMGQAAPTTITTDNVSYTNPVLIGADNVFTGSNTFTQELAGNYQAVIRAGPVSTAVTTELVSVNGLNISGHCVFSATNALAATNIATMWLGPINAGGTVSWNHVATAGMNIQIICTPH